MTAETKPLERFYAVTNTAAYIVEIDADEPFVMKITIRHGWASRIEAGSILAGDTVVVTAIGIFTCTKKNGKYYILGNTAPLVGLFMDETEALAYAASDRHSGADEEQRTKEADMITQAIIALNNPRLLVRDPLSFIYNEVIMPE